MLAIFYAAANLLRHTWQKSLQTNLILLVKLCCSFSMLIESLVVACVEPVSESKSPIYNHHVLGVLTRILYAQLTYIGV